jgi:hypothetical protein
MANSFEMNEFPPREQSGRQPTTRPDQRPDNRPPPAQPFGFYSQLETDGRPVPTLQRPLCCVCNKMHVSDLSLLNCDPAFPVCHTCQLEDSARRKTHALLMQLQNEPEEQLTPVPGDDDSITACELCSAHIPGYRNDGVPGSFPICQKCALESHRLMTQYTGVDFHTHAKRQMNASFDCLSCGCTVHEPLRGNLALCADCESESLQASVQLGRHAPEEITRWAQPRHPHPAIKDCMACGEPVDAPQEGPIVVCLSCEKIHHQVRRQTTSRT